MTFNFFKNILRHKKRIAGSMSMHPVREWFTGLAIAFVILSAGAAYAGQFLIRNLGSGGYAEGVAVEVTTYKATVVQGVLETYRVRAHTFEALRSAPAVGSIITPSTSGQTNTGEPIGAQ